MSSSAAVADGLVYVGSDDNHLYALDARTGTPVEGFGSGGKIDLRSGLPASAADKFVISNTPGTVFKDLIIMPLRISEGPGGAPGDIIAFNAITGEADRPIGRSMGAGRAAWPACAMF